MYHIMENYARLLDLVVVIWRVIVIIAKTVKLRVLAIFWGLSPVISMTYKIRIDYKFIEKELSLLIYKIRPKQAILK